MRSRLSTDQIVVEVRTSELLDGVWVIPRDKNERSELLQIFQQHYPGLAFKISASGIIIPSSQSDLLLSLDEFCDVRWTQDARLFVENRYSAKSNYPRLREKISEIVNGDVLVAKQTLHKHRDRLTGLDNHQWVNVAAMTLPDSFGMCIFDEQGAGKTVTFIHAFDILFEKNRVDFALIVAPKSMIPEWKEDFRKFTGDLYKVEIITGDKWEKTKALSSGADILVTNFETIVSMENEIRSLVLRYGKRAVLVVDESFFMKNLNAKRTRALRRVREYCGPAYVLCGTPAPNSAHDLVQQFNIVDYGLTFDGLEIPDDKNAAYPIIQSAIEDSGIYVRHMKSDVLPDLPPKRFNRILIPLNPVQQRLYKSALDGLILDLQETDEQRFNTQVTSFLARRNALLQICSNPGRLVEGYTETPSKIEVLDELLNEVIENRSEKVVLWSFYTHSLNMIFERYKVYNPVRYDGSISSVEDRRNAIHSFQSDNQTMLFVGNPAAAGAGITLHRSHIAIYESMSNQAAHYLQSLDRIHRRGQVEEVEYVVLLSDGTIEVPEYYRLMDKEQLAHNLLGDKTEDPITREIMLNELEEARTFFGEKYG
jgi:SNF2 family DNA or RNA helicase